jgi:hypothetical protein
MRTWSTCRRWTVSATRRSCARPSRAVAPLLHTPPSSARPCLSRAVPTRSGPRGGALGSLTFPRPPSHEPAPRAVRSTGLSILRNVHRRFARQVIYTAVSDILVSVNPYQDLDLYSGAPPARPPHWATRARRLADPPAARPCERVEAYFRRFRANLPHQFADTSGKQVLRAAQPPPRSPPRLLTARWRDSVWRAALPTEKGAVLARNARVRPSARLTAPAGAKGVGPAPVPHRKAGL